MHSNDNCPASSNWDDVKDCCTSSNPCGVGEGDCDNDNECQSGLKCGTDNCPAYLGFTSIECDATDSPIYEGYCSWVVAEGLCSETFIYNNYCPESCGKCDDAVIDCCYKPD